ncbi:MAG: 2-C-methyl-D-erythritol 4-phosphate cytidylyltransferase [Chthoniobacterales bacterium]
MLSAIIVAAGSSRRMGFDKLFVEIVGKPVIAHSLNAFARAESVNEIIIVAHEDRHRDIKQIVRDENLNNVRAIVRGGKHRHDSVRAGLGTVSSDAEYIAVHDAARPLVTPQQIEHVFEKCRYFGAASLAEPIRDTVKRADVELRVAQSVDRHELYAMQTPQIFERKILEQAYQVVSEKMLLVTDEVSAVELIGRKVALVVNDEFNFKITYPRDLSLAGFILRQRGV